MILHQLPMLNGEVIKVVLVDDHAVVREGLEVHIGKDEAMMVVASVGSGTEALDYCRDNPADIVLLDLRMPDMDGFHTLRQLRVRHPQLPILILSSDARDESVRKAIEAGATGFLPKSVRGWDVVSALRVVATTGKLPLSRELKERLRTTLSVPLSTREEEILNELARGASNDDIAASIDVSLHTVKTHVASILGKLGAESRTQAVVMALRRGLIDVE